MRRLTPDKIRGCALPDKARRINRGNTSIIYTTDDPDKLEVFTIERLKMDWWQDGLGIIERYDEPCEALYSGYKFNRHYSRARYELREYVYMTLPVYHCFVRRLEMPGKAEKRLIRSLQKRIYDVMWTSQPLRPDRPLSETLRWQALYERMADVEQVRLAAEFALMRDSNHIHPDFGPGDWAVKDGEIVCIDPFHHHDLQAAFLMSN